MKKVIIESIAGFPPITIQVENFKNDKNKYNIRGFAGDFPTMNKIMDSKKGDIDISNIIIGGSNESTNYRKNSSLFLYDLCNDKNDIDFCPLTEIELKRTIYDSDSDENTNHNTDEDNYNNFNFSDSDNEINEIISYI